MNDYSAKNYTEVDLDRIDRPPERFYKNPLTKAFQYEYALYLAVSGLFESVRCRSRCVESLKLYFTELGHKQDRPEDGDDTGSVRDEAGKSNRAAQEGLLKEMELLVNRDVVGHVEFPMMHICAAESKTILEKDGTHSLVFTDGIYGFKLHIDVPAKGHPRKIEVSDLFRKESPEAAPKPQTGEAAKPQTGEAPKPPKPQKESPKSVA